MALTLKYESVESHPIDIKNLITDDIFDVIVTSNIIVNGKRR